MKSVRIAERVFYQLTCDSCGEKSPEFEGFDPPDGWIEHEVPVDLSTLAPVIQAADSGVVGGSYMYYFDSVEHLELWKKQHAANPLAHLEKRRKHQIENPFESSFLNNKLYHSNKGWR